jgi:hypothetical protein
MARTRRVIVVWFIEMLTIRPAPAFSIRGEFRAIRK